MKNTIKIRSNPNFRVWLQLVSFNLTNKLSQVGGVGVGRGGCPLGAGSNENKATSA